MRLDLHPRVGHLPGGGAVEVLARDGNPMRFKLPDILTHSRCCNFSFSGLKTAAKKHIARVAGDSECAMWILLFFAPHVCTHTHTHMHTHTHTHAHTPTAGWREEGPLPGCEHLCAAFQQAVCRHLLLRTHRAIHFCQSEGLGISDLVSLGSVACIVCLQAKNTYTRRNNSLHLVDTFLGTHSIVVLFTPLIKDTAMICSTWFATDHDRMH